QDVLNAGREWKRKNPDERFISDGTERCGVFEQWLDLADGLEQMGYLTRNITVLRKSDGEDSRGTVYSTPQRLEVLRHRGHLTLMDSTHDTNWLGWYLYTTLVRDEHGSWRPVAHIFTEKEDGDVLAAALQVLKQWCGGSGGWNLRYILTDDSASEQRAFSLAFPGLEAGETAVTHLLCLFHSEQTLKRNLSGPACKKAYRHLQSALRYRKTGPGCEDSIRSAIDSAPDSKKAYIEKEWWNTQRQWAMAYRQHSPLLLQVSTTSPVEGYHSVVKGTEGKAILQRFSLLGTAKLVDGIDKDWDFRAAAAARNFRSKMLPQLRQYPALQKMPTPIQRMICDEIRASEQEMEAGEEARELDDACRCDCLWFRKYQLPCRHIWTQHALWGTLKEEDFQQYIYMFEDSGFELYERIGTEYYEREIEEEIGAPVRRRLDMREVLDSVKSRFYELEEQVAGLPFEEANRVMQWWIDSLDRVTGEVRKAGVEEFRQSHLHRVEDNLI
ncbi:MAG: hypothetical protein M1835_003450, partial [Candelina submexicana]